MMRRVLGTARRQALRLDVAGETSCLLQTRSFHSIPPRLATYKRFGQGSQASPAAAPPVLGQNIFLQQLAARARGGGGGGGGKGKQGGNGIVIVGGLAGVGGVYYVYHLERVPATGRMRFIDISREQELEIGKYTSQQTMQEYRAKLLPNSDPRVKFVRATAQRIINALHESDYASDHMNTGAASDSMESNDSRHQPPETSDVKWEVFVIDDPKTPNAFVTSNGKIFVFSGILPICQDQDGLATVLGHEIAHQLARHVAEKVSGTKVLSYAAVLLSLLGLDIGISQGVATLVLSLPNSRKVETEADDIGLQLMSRACFDPRKAPSLWERMQKAEGGEKSAIANAFMSIVSTHPLSKKRMDALQSQVPRALETKSQAGCPDMADVRGFRSASRPQYSF